MKWGQTHIDIHTNGDLKKLTFFPKGKWCFEINWRADGQKPKWVPGARLEAVAKKGIFAHAKNRTEFSGLPTHNLITVFFSNGATAASGRGSSQYRGFTITLRHTSLCRTPLDE
jgi:hypothetical protein